MLSPLHLRKAVLSTACAGIVCAISTASASKLEVVYPMPDERWEYTPILGADDAITTETLEPVDFDDPPVPTISNEIRFRINETGAFGFYQTTDLVDEDTPLESLNILGVKWHLTTDAENPEDVPEFRLRATAGDASFTQTYVLQDAFANDDHDSENIPLAGKDYVFQSFTDVPPFIVNGFPTEDVDGLAVAFDVMSFVTENVGRIGKYIGLKEVEAVSYTPGSLKGPELVYNESLGNGSIDWEMSDTMLGGYDIEHLRTEKGLGIRTFGPAGPDTVNPDQFNFSFGWWEKADVFTLEPGKIYRVKFVATLDSVDGEDSELDAIPTRLRFADENLDFTATVELGANFAGETEGNPSGESQNFFAWVAFPPELAEENASISVYWDVWQDLQPVDEGVSIFLKNLQIFSYDFEPKN